jgi:hypothetical protein
MKKLTGKRERNRTGYSITELPLALLILFVFGAFPLMALSLTALRMAFVNLTCNEAVRAAAGTQTFSLAQTAAKTTVANLSQAFTGLVYNFQGGSNGSLTIYQTPLSPNGPPDPQPYNGGPIQTSQYLYQYQLSMPTQIQPILQYSGGLFGNVPGWSAPIQMNVTASAYCENPQGLNQ